MSIGCDFVDIGKKKWYIKNQANVRTTMCPFLSDTAINNGVIKR